MSRENQENPSALLCTLVLLIDLTRVSIGDGFLFWPGGF